MIEKKKRVHVPCFSWLVVGYDLSRDEEFQKKNYLITGFVESTYPFVQVFEHKEQCEDQEWQGFHD